MLMSWMGMYPLHLHLNVRDQNGNALKHCTN